MGETLDRIVGLAKPFLIPSRLTTCAALNRSAGAPFDVSLHDFCLSKLPWE